MADKKPWEEFAQQPEANPDAKPWEQFGGKTAPSGFFRRAADYGIDALKGAVELPQAAVGLTDLATGGQAGKALEGIGYRPKEAIDTLNEMYSPERQAANKAVADAKGFFPTVAAAVQNPSTILGTAVESAPSMLGAGGIARGAIATGELAGARALTNPVLAGAIGEGALSAGQNAEQVRAEDPNGTLTPQQSAILAASGALTGALGYGAGRVANKLGIGDVETMLAQGKLGAAGENAIQAGASKGFLRKAGEGFATEGVLQELPQSYQEQVAQNLAQGKPWSEGAAEAGAQGMLAGGLTGAPAAILEGGHGGTDTGPATAPTAQTTPEARPEQPPQPGPMLALPPPVINVDSQGNAITAEDRNAQTQFERENLAARMQRINSGDIIDVTPISSAPERQTESQAMGIDPNAGMISSAAAVAVDTGAHAQSIQETAKALSGEVSAKEAKQNPSVAPTSEPVTQDRVSEIQSRLDFIQQQGRATGWNKEMVAQRNRLRDELGKLQQQNASEASAKVAPGNAQKNPTQESKAPLEAAASAVPATAPASDIKSVVAKQIPQMSDAEIQQAIDYYGPDHKRTPKLMKELSKRGVSLSTQPAGVTNVAQAPEAQQAGTKPSPAAGEAPASAVQAAAHPVPGSSGSESARTVVTPPEGLINAPGTANAGQKGASPTTPQVQGAQTQPIESAQGEKAASSPARATREQIKAAGDRWQTMTTVERTALAGQIEAQPIIKKNLPRASFGDLNVNLQRKLAQAMQPREPLTYEKAKSDAEAARARSKAAGEALNAFPKLPNGLTPDEVKASPEWQAAKRESDKALEDERAANSVVVRNFRKENVADIKAERERRAAESAAIDAAAHEAATSPKNDLPEPTQAQKEAGNYTKGHINVQGLDVTVENPRGSERTGKREDGSEWRHTMSDHYGYIKRTLGADGEQVDVYVGPKPESSRVFVVDQLNQQTGGFDEHKVMMGFDDEASAQKAYSSNFDKGWKVGQIRLMSMDEFKSWLKEGDTRKPASEASGPETASKPSESVAAPAKKARGVLAKKEAAEEAARFDYFKPGNIVKSYGGFDRVIAYTPSSGQDAWSVTVHAVEKQSGKWVDVPGARDRTHFTQPKASDMKSGPVGRVATPESESAAEFPLKEASASYSGISHSGSSRAKADADEFQAYLDGARDAGMAVAHTDAQKAAVEQATAELSDDYLTAYRRLMDVRADTYSGFVAGRSGLNGKQADKRNNAYDRAIDTFTAWQKANRGRVRQAALDARTDDEKAADQEAASRAIADKAQRKEDGDLNLMRKILSWKKGGDPVAIGKSATLAGVNLGRDGYPTSVKLAPADGSELIDNKFDLTKLFRPTGMSVPASKARVRELVDAVRAEDAATQAQADPVAPQTEASLPSEVSEDFDPAAPMTLAGAEESGRRVDDGALTSDELRARWASFRRDYETIRAELSKLTKSELLDRLDGMSAHRYKNENKDRVVEKALEGLAMGFRLSTGDNFFSYSGRLLDAIDRAVQQATDEGVAAHAGRIAEARKARAERAEAYVAAAKDPQTLEDYRIALRAKMDGGMSYTEARMSLTPEQRARFDELAGEASRDARSYRKEQRATEVRAAGQLVDGKIIETKHTKLGHDLFVVQLAERVSREDYDTLNAGAKKLGGGYSSYRGNGATPGFQFRSKESAAAFVKLAGGDAGAAQEAVHARRDAFSDDKSQSAAERLTEMADRLDERADESLSRDRKANTARRARFAASAEASANADKALAATMRNLADAIQNGTVKFLDRVRQKVQVEFLNERVKSARYDHWKATSGKTDAYSQPVMARLTAEVADYAEFPAFTAFRSDLARLGRDLQSRDGFKKLGKQLLSVADDVTDAYAKFAKDNFHKVSIYGFKEGGIAAFKTEAQAEMAIDRSSLRGRGTPLQIKRGEWAVVMSPAQAREHGLWDGDDDKRITLKAEFGRELLAKIDAANKSLGRLNKIEAPWQFSTANERLGVLSRLGLETASEYRAALREFIGLRETPKEADKIKQMERALVGRKNDGLDFFPTSPAVVAEMLDAAGIEPGMRVLEPSAGMGHIADQIREQAGVDPEVVEFSPERRELLEAKGYNVVGSDFAEFNQAQDRGFTYGDVFRRISDGRLGVMSGSGGMGSRRVGFYPLDENGAIKPRIGKDGAPALGDQSWENVEDLEGVDRRGVDSGYDRIVMNPPFSNGRDIEHVQHAYDLLKPGGRIVAIMGEGAFFRQGKKAEGFRAWLDDLGATSEKLPEGSFMDPTLPVNTGANARMVVIDKPANDVETDPRIARIEGAGANADAAMASVETEGRTPADTNQTRESDRGAIFSRGEEAIPESDWLSVGDTVEQVENLLKPFATEVPVSVIDRASDVLPALALDDDVSSGITYQGRIYLVREGLADHAAVQRTLFHELLHFGIRRFLTKDQYIAQMAKLSASDGWIDQRAKAWVASPEGNAVADKEGGDYALARGADEALAELAEIVHDDPTGFRTNSLKARLIRAVRKWVAAFADAIGLHEAAKTWRSFAAQDDAREFVSNIFRKLKDGEAPRDGATFIYSDPAFMHAVSRGTPEQIKSAAGENDGFAPSSPSFLGADGAKAKSPGMSRLDKVVFGMAVEGQRAGDVLGLIRGASHSQFNRQLAGLLLKTGINPTISISDGSELNKGGKRSEFAAVYYPDANKVSMFRPFDAERHMLHELVHAATAKAIEKPGIASTRMKLLYQHVQKNGGINDLYGMKNVDEFVAEAFTNPNFQQALRQISAPAGSPLRSAWDALVRIVKSILGMPAHVSDSALSAALDLGVGVMRENMALRGAANGPAMGSIADAKAYTRHAVDTLNQTFSAPGKVSWWHKTVGTMYNLAERSPEFKRVFDAAQGFVDDVSKWATDSADMAPSILPKLETWQDIAKRPVSAEDNKAIARPIFEGTLSWSRDLAGRPALVDDLVAQAEKLTADEKAQRLLGADQLSHNVYAMWQGMKQEQYEANINARYASAFLQPGIVWTDAELRKMFGLNDGQIGLYREFRQATDRSLDTMARSDMLRYGGEDAKALRDAVMNAPSLESAAAMLRDHFAELAQQDPSREEHLMVAANGMMDRADKVSKLSEKGYAPLSRFGQYTVDVVEGGERKYFGLFETAREANKMAERMRKEFGAAAVSQGTLSNESFKLFAGITPETLELFGNALGLDSTGDSARDQAFQEYLRLTKSNRSAMKRMIHRQGIAGYSEDVGRVLAAFIYSNARNTAAGLNIGDLGEAVEAIPKHHGELKDVAYRLADYVKNPQEEAQAIRGFLFAQYLGGSIASAFVNMSQPVAVTFPWLSQFGGARNAAAQLGKAAKNMATKGFAYEKDLAAALKDAEDDGTVSPQEVHQLMAQAQGRGSLRAGDGTKQGDAIAHGMNALKRVSFAWGKVFGMAEQTNRRVTFIAAYRIAQQQGMADPAAFAKRAVIETQFQYSKANKMQWGRGAIGGTLMTFKTYSIAYLELLHRMYTQGGPDGKKAAMLALGVLMVMGGAGGLPFSGDVEDVADGLAQLLGYNFNSKAARQEFLEDVFGSGIASFIDRGITGLPGVPIDVAGRLGMGNLIPATGLLQNKTSHTSDVLELVGPAGDFAKRIAQGAGQALNGDIGGGLMSVAPQAVRNAAKGADMAATGMYRDDKGYKVLDTSSMEAALKAIGFQPNSVATIQGANAQAQQSKSFYNLRAQEIRAKWAQGIFEGDPEKVQSARDDIAAWNEKNPDQRMLISVPSVMSRVREMRKSKDQRIAASAPKAMRAQMRTEFATIKDGL